MTRAKETKGRGETEILVKTSCMINTYRFIEKKSEEKKVKRNKFQKKQQDKEFKKPRRDKIHDGG